MNRFFFLFLLTISFFVEGVTIDLRDRHWSTSITLEHTPTWEQQQWGMMGRRTVPNDWGMTFSYPEPRILHFWMFNCYVDLDVAFLDENKVIKEIHTLKAYPEKMDPSRPVMSLRDFIRYPPHDEIIQFFLEKAVYSQKKIQFSIETRKDWFRDHGIKKGDLFLWEEGKSEGVVIHPLNIDDYPSVSKILVLEESCVAIRTENNNKKIQFIDRNGNAISPKELHVNHGKSRIVLSPRGARLILFE